jgi:hypothetical protein
MSTVVEAETNNDESKVDGKKKENLHPTDDHDNYRSDEQVTTTTTSTAMFMSENNNSGGNKESDTTDDKKSNTTNPSTNNLSKNKQNKKKRKRAVVTEEDIISMQQERYDKLFYTAHKQLHKHAKQVKAFLLQKEIRKQKQATTKDENETTNNTISNKKIQQYKELDLELVTKQALRQLGVYHSNPRLKVVSNVDRSEDSNNSDEETPEEEGLQKEALIKIPLAISSDHPDYNIVTSLLKHKRFLQTLEEWNSKIAEYRKWCLQLEERESYFQSKKYENSSTDNKKRKSGNKNTKGRQTQQDPAHYGDRLQTTSEEPSALFCTLGSEDEDDHDLDEGKKKNRKGQRARKAKAMALDAKREGRTDFQSLNWRASSSSKNKSQQRQEEDQHGNNNNNNNNNNNKYDDRFNKKPTRTNRKRDDFDSKQQDSSKQTKTSTTAAGPDHPSWAAKQAQKTGIVAFQGKKITFD